MHNKEVKKLQQALNKLGFQVAEFGEGSPGQETTYFGLKTAKAVVKFQKKFSDEVLEPLGLTEGTGYLGTLTKRKINKLLRELKKEGETANVQEELQKIEKAILELKEQIKDLQNRLDAFQ